MLTRNYKLTQEKQYKDGYQNVEVVDKLALQALEEARPKQSVPGTVREEGQEQEEDYGYLGVEEAGDQGPLKAHDGRGAEASKTAKQGREKSAPFQARNKNAAGNEKCFAFIHPVPQSAV